MSCPYELLAFRDAQNLALEEKIFDEMEEKSKAGMGMEKTLKDEVQEKLKAEMEELEETHQDCFPPETQNKKTKNKVTGIQCIQSCCLNSIYSIDVLRDVRTVAVREFAQNLTKFEVGLKSHAVVTKVYEKEHLASDYTAMSDKLKNARRKRAVC